MLSKISRTTSIFVKNVVVEIYESAVTVSVLNPARRSLKNLIHGVRKTSEADLERVGVNPIGYNTR